MMEILSKLFWTVISVVFGAIAILALISIGLARGASAPCIKHGLVLTAPDSADPTIVSTSEWNDCHVITLLVSAQGNVSGAKTIDWNNGITQTMTLTGNTVLTLSNPVTGTRYRLLVKQDATGYRTLTFPASVKLLTGSTAINSAASSLSEVFLTYDGADYFTFIPSDTGGGGGSALTVMDVDGTPTATNVNTMRFTNGTVSNDGGGQVTITIAGGGGSGTPGGSNTQCQYNNAGAFGGVSSCTSNGTTMTIANLVIDASWKLTNAGTDRVVLSNPAENVLQMQGQGNSKTTAFHLNPGSGTLPTGTVAEVVIGRTNSQAFGGNYGRWSFTTLGSANGNVSGIYGEYGGSTPQAPFIFHYGYEASLDNFTNWEFWRAIADTAAVAEGAYAGSTLFGATDGTSRNKVVLSMPSIGAAGQRDSHAFLREGKANDGTERAVWWRDYVDVTSNAGASTWKVQNNLNGAGWNTRLGISDTGIFCFGDCATNYLEHNTTAVIGSKVVTWQNLAGIAGLITGATPVDSRCAKFTVTSGNISLSDAGAACGGGGGGSTASLTRLKHNASQATGGSTYTAVFNAEQFDTAGWHDNTTNNSRTTFATDQLCQLNGNARLQHTAADTSFLFFHIVKAAGGTEDTISNQENTTGAAAVNTSVSTAYKFLAGDYVELQIFSTANINISANEITMSILCAS